MNTVLYNLGLIDKTYKNVYNTHIQKGLNIYGF